MQRLSLLAGVLLLAAACDKEEEDHDLLDDYDFEQGGGFLDGNDDGQDTQLAEGAPKIIAADVSCDYTDC